MDLMAFILKKDIKLGFAFLDKFKKVKPKVLTYSIKAR